MIGYFNYPAFSILKLSLFFLLSRVCVLRTIFLKAMFMRCLQSFVKRISADCRLQSAFLLPVRLVPLFSTNIHIDIYQRFNFCLVQAHSTDALSRHDSLVVSYHSLLWRMNFLKATDWYHSSTYIQCKLSFDLLCEYILMYHINCSELRKRLLAFFFSVIDVLIYLFLIMTAVDYYSLLF